MICAPLGPRPNSSMTSARRIQSRMSMSGVYGSSSAPGSRFRVMESRPWVFIHTWKAWTRVVFPQPAVPRT